MTDHRSDCAVHNGPAMPAEACDCGIDATAARAEIVAWLEAQAANYEDAYNRDPEDPRARAFAVLNDAAMDIASGAPQRWAAERDAHA